MRSGSGALSTWGTNLGSYVYFTGKMFVLFMRTAFNPFMPNGISHRYQLEQSISVLRDVGWYFSFLFKF